MKASPLTTTCQNEDELKSACGPAMRKALRDSSSRGAMSLIGVDDWISERKNKRILLGLR